MKQTIVFQDQGKGSMKWELETSPALKPDVWEVTNVVLSGGPVGLWVGRVVRFLKRTKDNAELVWMAKGDGWFPLDIPVIEHHYHNDCPHCGHSLADNHHGFDQNDAYLDGDSLVHSGSCTYCKICNPPHKEEAPMTNTVDPSIFEALRVLMHSPHAIMLASGNGKLLVLKPDQEIDLVDDPRADYHATSFPSQALVRQGETLTLQYERVEPRSAMCAYMIGSNNVLVSFATKEDPIHDDSAKELIDYLRMECAKIGVHLRVEARK